MQKWGVWQGGALSLSQAQPVSKQLNLNQLSDGDGLKLSGKPTTLKAPFLDCERYISDIFQLFVCLALADHAWLTSALSETKKCSENPSQMACRRASMLE